jgi:hypothetical protein
MLTTDYACIRFQPRLFLVIWETTRALARIAGRRHPRAIRESRRSRKVPLIDRSPLR